MTAKTVCPSCQTEIEAKATICPECQMKLEVSSWEINESIAWVSGSIAAIGWLASGLIAVGANPLIAIVLSIVLLVSFPTVIGFGIAVGLTANIYGIPALGLAFRAIVALIGGGLIGAIAGIIVGRLLSK